MAMNQSPLILSRSATRTVGMDLSSFFLTSFLYLQIQEFLTQQQLWNTGPWIKIQGPGTNSFGHMKFSDDPFGGFMFLIVESHQVGPCWTIRNILSKLCQTCMVMHGPEKCSVLGIGVRKHKYAVTPIRRYGITPMAVFTVHHQP